MQPSVPESSHDVPVPPSSQLASVVRSHEVNPWACPRKQGGGSTVCMCGSDRMAGSGGGSTGALVSSVERYILVA